MRYKWTIGLVTLLIILNCSAKDVYVSPNGSDANLGTIASPFFSLESARNAVRSSPGTVWLLGGSFVRSNALNLGVLDNNTAYRAFSNSVTITSLYALTNFVSITNQSTISRLSPSAKTNVLIADVSIFGNIDLGTLNNRGAVWWKSGYSGKTRPWMAELFFDDKRQQIARWPNQDRSQEAWAYTVSPVASAGGKWFSFRENNPNTWARIEPVWVHGMWANWWADSYLQVLSVYSSTNAMYCDRAGDFGFAANQPYEALNALEELDQPGEWVIDPTNKLVYFWPPSNNPNIRTSLSIIASDFVDATNASNVSFIGLTFDGILGSAINLVNCTNVSIAGCSFQNCGNLGVVIGNAIYTNSADILPYTYDYQGGISNSVVGCVFRDTGEGGIAMSGGNRYSLYSCYNAAVNNYFSNFNTNIRCYRPAIRMDGVGCSISHAVMRDSAHQAVFFSGNDHLIEYCNIYLVCKDTDDAGVIYSVANDWAQQGTTIRYNMIQPCPKHGIYLDDFTSGDYIYGNVLFNTLYPILLGGGRGNVVSNNLVLGYNSVGWTVSNRGVYQSRGAVSGLANNIVQVPYTNQPYWKYPEMSSISNDIALWTGSTSDSTFTNLGTAKDNLIASNLFIATTAYYYDITSNQIPQYGNNYWAYLTWFTNFTAGQTALAMQTRNFSGSGVQYPSAWTQIPFSSIGCYDDTNGLVSSATGTNYPLSQSRAAFYTLTIPGTIQAVDYDNGPQGNTYTATNSQESTFNPTLVSYGNNASGSGRYRLDSPFYIWGSLINGARQYAMDFTANSWCEYTINVSRPGPYQFSIAGTIYQSPMHANLDSLTITPSMNSNATATVTLTTGSHTLRLVNESSTLANRLSSFTFTPLSYTTASSFAGHTYQ